MDVEHQIHHGPWVPVQGEVRRQWQLALAGIQSTVFLNTDTQPVLKQLTAEASILQIYSQIGITGDVTGHFEGKPMTLQGEEGKSNTVWQGMIGQWQINQALNKFQAEVSLPGFDVNWGARRYVGQELTLKTQRYRADNGLWLGSDNLFIQQFQFLPTNPEMSVRMQAITMGSVLDLKKGLVNTALNTTIEELMWKNQSYGPMNTQIALNRLAPEAAKSLIDNIHQMQMTGHYQPYLTNMMLLVPALLKSRPELHMDNFSLRTPKGEVKGHLQIAIGGSDAHDTMQIGNIIDSLFATAGIVMPQQWLQGLGLDIDIPQYEKLGYLVVQGDHYATDARYESGNLTINGHPWPPTPSIVVPESTSSAVAPEPPQQGVSSKLTPATH